MPTKPLLLLITMALWLGVLPTTAAEPTAANPRAAELPPCQVAKDGTSWTLRQSCALKRAIRLPNGVTLDGRGRTIVLTGPRQGFSAGILVEGGSGSVRDLILNGRGLTGLCAVKPGYQPFGTPVTGIEFANASGTIQDVAIDNLCGPAIVVHAQTEEPRPEVVLERIKISRVFRPRDNSIEAGRGVATIAGTVDARVNGGVIRQPIYYDAGIRVEAGATATIKGIAVLQPNLSIAVIEDSKAVIRDSRLLGVADMGLFVNDSNVTAVGNQVVGTSEPSASAVRLAEGIVFNANMNGGGTEGRADMNSVSGFRCGILVRKAARPYVTIGDDNRFPPPGSPDANKTDVCSS